MRSYLLLIFSLCPVLLFPQTQAFITDTLQFNSEILKETRNIIVIKPTNMSGHDPVKVLYMTDGEFSAYRVQKWMEKNGNCLTNLIAVGIVNTDRRRDLLYVKGANNFLEFLASELIPAIEKDYTCKKRILFGHSFGGSFAIYAMLNKPEYFNCYIASSPTPIMDLIQKENYVKMDSEMKSQVDFYLSYGSNDMKQVIKWADILNGNLTGISFTNLNWHFNVFEGADHNTSDIPALFEAAVIARSQINH
ncbi:MAG TPA: alpha/beta hydrolase-fold protein [Bacteroidales bacterium]|nr:alpha/beta hydrolase-fold protein [Bacteroidales bacterium]